jgi:hypothetical protein
MQLTWSAQVNDFGRKVAQRPGKLGSRLNPSSGLYNRRFCVVSKPGRMSGDAFVLLSEDLFFENTCRIKFVELKSLPTATCAH